jgi:acyl-ACP thioesterase
MDNNALILLARFTFQARKFIGAIDSNQLVNNTAYRHNIFQQLDAQADEDLLILSMQLRNILEVAPVQNTQNQAEILTSAQNGKYKFGARS